MKRTDSAVTTACIVSAGTGTPCPDNDVIWDIDFYVDIFQRVGIAAATTAAPGFTVNTGTAAATAANTEYVNAVFCAFQIRKGQCAGSQETDFPVVLGYGDRFIRIVDDLVISGVDKGWNDAEGHQSAVIRGDFNGLARPLFPVRNGHRPGAGLQALKDCHAGSAGGFGIGLAILADGHGNASRGGDGQSAAGATAGAESVQLSVHRLTST